MLLLKLNRTALAIIALSLVMVGTPAWAAGAQRSDFNGDGKSDVLWRHSSGAVAIWLMDGTQTIGDGQFGVVDPEWQIAGVGDFNVDGRTDILWRNGTGTLAVWLMDGTSIIGSGIVTRDGGQVVGATPGSRTLGTGDYDGDGRADILWWMSSTPQNYSLKAWLMDDGIDVKSRIDLPAAGAPNPSPWQVVGSGDYNADGRSDLFWRHSSGALAIWFVDGGPSHRFQQQYIIGGGGAGTADPAWQVVGWGDYNADGRADILWRHSSGAAAIWMMNGTQAIGGGLFTAVDPAWQIVGTGDYDGDGRADILWRHSSGAAAIWLMDGTQTIGGGGFAVVDPAWQIVNTP